MILYRMQCCHICGEEKPKGEFNHLPNFTKYKKGKVIWCRSCQKMWIDQKREQEYKQKYLDQPTFSVSFH